MSHAAPVDNHIENGPPHVHHMDAVTAYHSAKLGMWLFLATEILLFGGLFAAFFLFRWQDTEAFKEASSHLSVGFGATNTVVLLISSFFAALAVDAAQHGKNKLVVSYFSVTLVCAVGFMVIKAIEWSAKYEHGLFPGSPEYHGLEFGSVEFAAKYGAFFGLYYCMTGLHAIHVLLGMGVILWAMSKAIRGRYSSTYYTPVELSALYWHIVDVIWIYLFPLLYLVG